MIPFLAQSLVEISWGHLKQVRPNKELCLEIVLFHKYEEPIQKYNQQPKLRNSKTIMGALLLHKYRFKNRNQHAQALALSYTRSCSSNISNLKLVKKSISNKYEQGTSEKYR